MIHARSDYNRIQDPALDDPSLLSKGSTAIGEDEPVFLVRAKDIAFCHAVKAWIDAHLTLGGDPEMANAAEEQIKLAQKWQKDNGWQPADAPPEALTPYGGAGAL